MQLNGEDGITSKIVVGFTSKCLLVAGTGRRFGTKHQITNFNEVAND